MYYKIMVYIELECFYFHNHSYFGTIFCCHSKNISNERNVCYNLKCVKNFKNLSLKGKKQYIKRNII